MRRTIASSLLLVAIAAGVPAQAQLDPLVLTRDSATFYPGGDAYPIPLIVPAGYKLMYQNLDTFQPHNVWSVGSKPDGTRLFRSPILPPWQVVEGVDPVEVSGVEQLPPGLYPFYCDIHPSMRGTLTVQ